MIIDTEVRAFAAKMSADLRDEFLAALEQITDVVVVTQLEAAIRSGDVDLALRIVGLDGPFLSGWVASILGLYAIGGRRVMADLSRRRVPVGVFQFGGRSPEAERWAGQKSSELIVLIQDPAREAIREVIRQGIADGKNPRSVALDIVGRTVNGKREGGLIGLSPDLVKHVESARKALREGDDSYFRKARRDKRFDTTVKKAFAAGKGLSGATLEKVVGRYASRLLAYRGERIARTETISALNAGRLEAMQQMVASGKMSANAILLRWKSALTRNTRDTHIAMHNQARRLGQPFVSPEGSSLMHPCDTSLGAPAQEVVNCRCFMDIEVKF